MTRNCEQCGSSFEPLASHHRLCARCFKGNQDPTYDPAAPKGRVRPRTASGFVVRRPRDETFGLALAARIKSLEERLLRLETVVSVLVDKEKERVG
jgi:protein-arginine kinase activator protein McsA